MIACSFFMLREVGHSVLMARLRLKTVDTKPDPKLDGDDTVPWPENQLFWWEEETEEDDKFRRTNTHIDTGDDEKTHEEAAQGLSPRQPVHQGSQLHPWGLACESEWMMQGHREMEEQ